MISRKTILHHLSTRITSIRQHRRRLRRECKWLLTNFSLKSIFRYFKAKRSFDQTQQPGEPVVENVTQKFGLFKLNTGVSLTNNVVAPVPTNFQIKFNLNATPSSILKDEKKLIVNKDLLSNPSINNRAGGFTLKNPTAMPSSSEGKVP